MCVWGGGVGGGALRVVKPNVSGYAHVKIWRRIIAREFFQFDESRDGIKSLLPTITISSLVSSLLD